MSTGGPCTRSIAGGHVEYAKGAVYDADGVFRRLKLFLILLDFAIFHVLFYF